VRLGTWLGSFMTCGDGRKQRRGYAFVTAAGHRQALLATRTAINERSQQREIISEIFEDALEIPFETGDSRPAFLVAPTTPRGKLARYDFLNGFPIGEVRGTASAASDEIVLAQRQTRG
jgi:hypothetical protein